MLSGIAIGAGKQTRGFTINAVAHWGFGLPTALLLGFYFKLGVEGLYAGGFVRGYSVGRCRGTFDVVKEWAERWAGICLPPSSLTSLLRPCQSLPSLCRTAAASAGVVLGPLVQWICYTWLVSRMDWEAEAVKAHRYMLEVADSMSGAGI